MTRLRGLIFCLLAVLMVPSLGWANGETLYVRPVATCANNGDGKAYGCAASGGAVGAFKGFLNILYNAANTSGQVDPGDKLYVCGTHTTQQLEIYQDGTATLPIEVDFSCPSDAGIINAATATNYALYVEASYLNIHGGRFSGGIFDSVVFPTNGGVNTDNSSVTFYDSTVTACGTTTTACVVSYGDNFTMRNVLVSGCVSQCYVSLGGQNTKILNNTLVDSGTTDGIMLSFITDGSVISGNYIDHRGADTKYCVIVKSTTTPGTTVVSDNTCIRDLTDIVGSGFYTDTGTTVKFLRNTLIGGRYGIHCANTTGFTCTIAGNLSITPTENCFVTGSAVGANIINNTCINPGLDGIFISLNTSAVTIQNNVVSMGPTNFCVNKQANNIEQYNDLYGCTTAVANNGTPTTSGTGTVVTNPLFFALTDFRLLSGSPAKGTGLASTVCFDIHGLMCNAPPDMGAYQVKPRSSYTAGAQ